MERTENVADNGDRRDDDRCTVRRTEYVAKLNQKLVKKRKMKTAAMETSKKRFWPPSLPRREPLKTGPRASKPEQGAKSGEKTAKTRRSPAGLNTPTATK